jgi:hypothetical protein
MATDFARFPEHGSYAQALKENAQQQQLLAEQQQKQAELQQQQQTSEPQMLPKKNYSSSEKEEKVSESKEGEDTSVVFKQILSSLAETKKYLPQRVNTFLDSMEGKSLEDLRGEAMQLAEKAKEEAKKKTQDVENIRKSTVESAKKTVHDVAEKSTDIANKGLEMVTNTTKATRERTSSLANKGMEIVSNTTKPVRERTSSLANKGLEVVQNTTKATADRVKEYLPEDLKGFIEKNIEGKTLNQLRMDAMNTTRKKLLSVEKENDPSLREFAMEVKDAVQSGTLAKNVLDISQDAVSNNVAKVDVSPDADSKTRLLEIGKTVTSKLRQVTMDGWNRTRKNTTDMINKQMDNLIRGHLAPFVDRYGTPSIRSTLMPYFDRFKASDSEQLRPGEQSSEARKSEGSEGAAPSIHPQVAKTQSNQPGSGLTTTGDEPVLSEHVETNIPPTTVNTDESGTQTVIEEEQTKTKKTSKKPVKG